MKDFDNSKFLSFGIIKDSILYLAIEEVDYLWELNIIKIKDMKKTTFFEIYLEQKTLFNKAIYGYFRRSVTIICWYFNNYLVHKTY